MRPPWSDIGRARRPALLAAAVVMAGFAALTIHVAAEYLGDPYPVADPPFWAQWIYATGRIAALAWFISLTSGSLDRYRLAGRFALLMTMAIFIGETFRVVIMNGYSNKAYLFAFLDLPRLLAFYAIVVAAALWIAHRTSRLPSMMAYSLAAGLAYQSLLPVLTGWFEALQAHFDYLNKPDLYRFPYPFSFQFWAYLLMIEPAVGVLLATVLLWKHLAGGVWRRTAVVTIFTVAIKGFLVKDIVYAFFAQLSVVGALLSYAQFFFEFAGLGLLVAGAWHLYGPAED